MEIILGIIKEYAGPFWMGMGLSLLFNIHFYNWKWWAYCIPLIFLMIWRGV